MGLLQEIIDYFWWKMHWRYFKYSDLLHTLNLYKMTVKEHQVVEFWAPDEI